VKEGNHFLFFGVKAERKKLRAGWILLKRIVQWHIHISPNFDAASSSEFQ